MYFWITPFLFPMRDPVTGIMPEPTWEGFFFKLAIGMVCLFVFSVFLILLNQDNFVFVPANPNQDFEDNSEGWCLPTERKLRFKDVHLETSDKVKLHGWHMSIDDKFDAPRDTVVFLHENTGNLGDRLDYFEMMIKQVGVNVLCVAYRGFSKSKGKPSESGLQMDAQAIAKFVKESPLIDKKRVYLAGRSLGGAVAIHLLAESDES